LHDGTSLTSTAQSDPGDVTGGFVGGFVGGVTGGVTGVVGFVAGVFTVRVSRGPAAPFSEDWNRAIAFDTDDVTANVYVPALPTPADTSKDTAAADAAGFTVANAAPTTGAALPDNVASDHDDEATLFTDTDDGNRVDTSRVSVNSAFATDAPAGNAPTVNLTKLTIRSPDFAPATSDSLPPNVYDGRADDEYESSTAATRTVDTVDDTVDGTVSAADAETGAANTTPAETPTAAATVVAARERTWRV
jgi:hypothetical protein